MSLFSLRASFSDKLSDDRPLSEESESDETCESCESCYQKGDDLTHGQQMKVKRSPTAEYLELLSKNLWEAHTNIFDPESMALLKRHCSLDFVMASNDPYEFSYPMTTGLDNHLREAMAVKRASPGFKIRAENITALYKKGSNTAQVFITGKGSGLGQSSALNRECVSILYWRKRKNDGVWIWYRHAGLCSGGDFFHE